jgi:hypothetical protein|tara:strand:- start:160 stop:372 length:213 start_codon:yes stop_codon:yes gene_type:complete
MENYKLKLKKMTELNADGNETRGREGESLLVEISPECAGELGQMGWDFGEHQDFPDTQNPKLNKKHILRG